MPRGWKKNAKNDSMKKREKAGGNSYKKKKAKKNILMRDEDKVDEFKKYKTLKEKRISENAKLNRTRAPLNIFRTRAEFDGVLGVKYDQWKKNKLKALKADKRLARGPRNTGISSKRNRKTMPLYWKKQNNDNRTIKVGDIVEVKLENWAKTYKGEVVKEHSNKTYKILFYVDGNIISKSNVSLQDITLLLSRSDIDKPSIGDRVKVKLARCKKLHKGKVVGDHGNGRFKILFPEGDIESNVDINNITLLSETKAKSRARKIKEILKYDSDDGQEEQECRRFNGSFVYPKHFIVSYRNKGDSSEKYERQKRIYERRNKRDVELRERKEREEREKEQEKFWARIAEILKDEEEEETSAADKSRTFVSVGSYPPTLKRHISDDGKSLIERALSLDYITEEETEQEEEDNQDLDYAGNVTLNDDEGWLLL